MTKETLRLNKKKILLFSILTIILLFIFVISVFSVGELYLRYKRKAWPFELEIQYPQYMTEKDKVLRWRFSPKDGRNSLGLRNKEIGEKRNGIYRILFLGDSLVWEGDTSSGKLYTELIQDNLNHNKILKDKKIEIINAGIPGYTTYQELEFLKIYGLDMKPDVLILGFVFNDLPYPYLHKPTQKGFLDYDPNNKLYHFDTSSYPGKLFSRSHMAHRCYYGFKTIVKKIKSECSYPFEQWDGFYLAWKEHAWGKTDELISEMKSITNKRNIPMIIVIYPIANQVDDQYLKIDKDYVLFPQKKIKEICNKYKIPFLDLTDTIYKNGGTSLYKDFLHLNNKGNDIIGEEITNYLIENKEIGELNRGGIK